jgi:hypothetical protein
LEFEVATSHRKDGEIYHLPKVKVPVKEYLDPPPIRLSQVFIEPARNKVRKTLEKYNKAVAAESILGPRMTMPKFAVIENLLLYELDQEDVDVIDAINFLSHLYLAAVVDDALNR